MKKLGVKILLFIAVVWAISMSYSYLKGSDTGLGIFESDGSVNRPGSFKLVMDQLSRYTGPKIRTESAMVFDLNSGEILLHKNEDSVRAIASLTKLVTAQVFLDSRTDLFKTETVMKADRDGAGRSRLRIGASVRLIDLFHLMLICSDNVAARIVSRSTGLDSAEFVDKMNRYAISLGLKYTHFADPTGLDANNVSTAAECSIIFKAALDKSLIAEVVAKKDYSFTPVNSKRAYVVHNTNRLLYGRQDIIGGKTGFIFEAGYCLALGAETQSGRKLGAILLGAPSSGCRFRDAARLLASVDNIKQSGF